MGLRSMTGFAVADFEADGFSLRCQIKSLNSRYLEVFSRLPRSMQAYETDVTALVKKLLERGKIEVSIMANEHLSKEQLPQINTVALEHFLDLQKQIQVRLAKADGANAPRGLSAGELMRMDGVLELPTKSSQNSEENEPQKTALLSCLSKALSSLKAEREREGAALQLALKDLVSELEKDRQMVAEKSEELLKYLYANYLKRLENFLAKIQEANLPTTSDLNKDRLYLEIGILTDKCDIEEELTRLKTHCEEFIACFANNDGVGRKLDFLCQEMHREVNTMSSKLQHSEVTPTTMRMKLTIERIRQQVQNIE